MKPTRADSVWETPSDEVQHAPLGGQALRALFETMAMGVVYQDRSGAIIAANPAAREILGLSGAEMRGRVSDDARWQAVREDETPLPGAEHPSMVALRTGRPVRQVVMGVFNPRDGQRRWLLVDAVPEFRPGEARPFRVYTTFSDLTARRTAEQALRTSEERLRNVIEALPLGALFYRLESDDRLVFMGANPAADTILNVACSRYIGLTIEEAFPPLAATEVPERYRAICRTGTAWHSEQIDYADERIRGAYEVHAFQTAPGEMAVVFSDITVRKRTEAERDRLFNLSLDMLCVAGLDGHLKSVNPAWTTTLGWTAEELTARPWLDFVHPEDHAATIAAGEQLHAGRPVWRFENRYRCKDGSYRWIAWNSHPLPDEGLIFAVARDVTEQRVAAQALEQARREWESIFQAIGHPVLILDPQQRILAANQAALQAVGRSAEALRGRQCHEVFHAPAGGVPAGCPATRLIADGAAQTVEMEIEALHGTHLVSCTPVLDSAGRLEKIIHVATDITELKRTERALLEREQSLDSIFRAAPIGIGLTSKRVLLRVNERLCAMLGYTAEELVGQSARVLYPTEADYEFVGREKYRQIGQFGTGTVETRWRRKDGRIIDVLLSSTPLDVTDLPAGVTFTALDITERKQIERNLRELTGRYEAILAAVPDIVMEVDRRKVYTWANPAGLRFFGDDVCGKPAEGYFVGAQDTYATVAPLFEGDENVIYVESWQRRQDGQHRLLAWWCRSLKASDGSVVGALSTARDITEQKRVEEEIRRLNVELNQRVEQRTAELQAANQELEAFAYSVSHDLRAPLRSIDGFSQALLEDCGGALDDAGREHLGRVRGAAQRMGRLIDDLLNLSRATRRELHPQPVDLSALAAGVLADLRAGEPERAVQTVVAPGLTCAGDPELLRVLLTNLLGNAWKFTRGRANATIAFGSLAADEAVRFGTTDRPVYFVRDNGAGFDMAYAHKLFVPFQRLHRAEDYPGTGVGLATVQRIARRHGGRVWAEGRVDGGATFYFTLG